MPTGYTAGILDGKIKDFKEFARVCIRAFGAAIHMRDDSLNKGYEPMKVDSYYTENKKKAINDLNKLKLKSDSKLIEEYQKQLEKDKVYYEDKLKETNKNAEDLNRILSESKNWTPPTAEHTAFKEFMINQLTETIKWDGDPSSEIEELTRIENELKSIKELGKVKIDAIRKEKIESLEKDIQYYTEREAEAEKRVIGSNEWVEVLVKSLK
jgi:hypothetical protein